MCIDRRSFCACLSYFIAFAPFLLYCSDTASFALCLVMCFYDHCGVLRASAATAMPFCRRRYKRRRFFLCSMYGTAYTCDISSGSRRVVFCGGFWLVLRVLCELLRERLRFSDFPCFSHVTPQNCPPYFFSAFPMLSGIYGFAGRRSAVPTPSP